MLNEKNKFLMDIVKEVDELADGSFPWEEELALCGQCATEEVTEDELTALIKYCLKKKVTLVVGRECKDL